MGIILINGQDRIEIKLETSKGNQIDNYQIFDISQFEKNQFSHFSSNNFPFAKFRTSPSPIYNCHGMSFASRRTNIDNSSEIRKILKEDGYEMVDRMSTLEGDIVLYITQENGDITHSATIVKVDHSENNISSIIVVGKWGKYKEVIHNLNDCPYKNCIFEFHRLTHKEYEV